VQGSAARNEIEDCLAEAGFYLPFSDVERWYRQQLDGTGISYAMVMGRPRVQFNRNNSVKNSMVQWERDQSILDSFAEEYKARQSEEGPRVKEVCGKAETIVAYVIYPTGYRGRLKFCKYLVDLRFKLIFRRVRVIFLVLHTFSGSKISCACLSSGCLFR
jgi:hypothetical protein